VYPGFSFRQCPAPGDSEMWDQWLWLHYFVGDRPARSTWPALKQGRGRRLQLVLFASETRYRPSGQVFMVRRVARIRTIVLVGDAPCRQERLERVPMCVMPSCV